MHATRPAALYADHLATVRQRAAAALERGGFDHLVVPSGTLHYQLFDDRDYPYAVNPQFKHWLPLTKLPYSWLVYTPGQRPQVIYYQPHDYWHVVPDAPNGWWVEHFDVLIIRKPEEALGLLPKAAGRCAILGEPQSALGDYIPNNPEPVINYLEYQRSYKTPYEIALMREAQRLAVRGHRAAEAAFRSGQVRWCETSTARKYSPKRRHGSPRESKSMATFRVVRSRARLYRISETNRG